MGRTTSNCECWFLDVGQGTSNVIMLGGGRAIVIDCGPRGSDQTISLLRQHIDVIEALIISHNDNDHDYNAPQILNEFRKATKRIFFLQDREVEKIELFRTIGTLLSAQDGDYPRPCRLETDDGAPRIIFSENNITLSVLYPDLMANLEAQQTISMKPNRTSAILRLNCGGRRIVFSGDATFEAWEYLSSKMGGGKRLECDIMTLPHHGGNITKDASIDAVCQEKLYSNIINPKYGIVSVGTINPYKHPIKETLIEATKAGVKVLCTQMTNKCCDDLETIRSIRRTIVRPARSKREESKTDGGRSRHVACFGSVVAEISPKKVTIANLLGYEENKQDFTKLQGFHQMCDNIN